MPAPIGPIPNQMSALLTLDTSGPYCAVALSLDGRISCAEASSERRAAQEVLPLVEELLQAQSFSLARLDGIAVVNGPGSFTGIRIGVAVAQGLGLSVGLPVLPVSALAAMARLSVDADSAMTGVLLAALPARKADYYLAAYGRGGKGELAERFQERVMEPREFLEETGLAPGDSSPRPGWYPGSFCLPVAESTDPDQEAATVIPDLSVTESEQRPAVEDHLAAVSALARESLRAQESGRDSLVLPNYVQTQPEYSRGS